MNEVHAIMFDSDDVSNWIWDEIGILMKVYIDDEYNYMTLEYDREKIDNYKLREFLETCGSEFEDLIEMGYVDIDLSMFVRGILGIRDYYNIHVKNGVVYVVY